MAAHYVCMQAKGVQMQVKPTSISSAEIALRLIERANMAKDPDAAGAGKRGFGPEVSSTRSLSDRVMSKLAELRALGETSSKDGLSIGQLRKASQAILKQLPPNASGFATGGKNGRQHFEAYRGTAGADVIAYAYTAQSGTAYVDGHDGDDLINFVSNHKSAHQVKGGAGNDVISFSAPLGRAHGGDGDDRIAIAGHHVGATGGAGNDVIAASGWRASANGGAGDDIITVSGDSVGARGGAGNDVITATGGQVSKVHGGDGDDIIKVSSKADSYSASAGIARKYYFENRLPTIEGGAGNDTINITGQGHVVFRPDGGHDVVTISDRTEFFTMGHKYYDYVMWAKDAQFDYDNGSLTVSWEGRDEMLTIKSETGALSWEVTEDRMFVVKPVRPESGT